MRLDALDGWVFCNTIALRWYYRIANKLIEARLSSRFSVASVIAFLKEVSKGKVNEKWGNYPLTKAELTSFEALGLSWDQ